MWTSSILNSVCEFQTTRKSEFKYNVTKRTRGQMFLTHLYVCSKHKQNAHSHSLKTHAPLPPSDHLSGFPDCSYQLDIVFFLEPLFSQLCADSLCTCVTDNKGMSFRQAREQEKMLARRFPCIVCFGQELSALLSVSFDGHPSIFQVNCSMALACPGCITVIKWVTDLTVVVTSRLGVQTSSSVNITFTWGNFLSQILEIT